MKMNMDVSNNDLKSALNPRVLEFARKKMDNFSKNAISHSNVILNKSKEEWSKQSKVIEIETKKATKEWSAKMMEFYRQMTTDANDRKLINMGKDNQVKIEEDVRLETIQERKENEGEIVELKMDKTVKNNSEQIISQNGEYFNGNHNSNHMICSSNVISSKLAMDPKPIPMDANSNERYDIQITQQWHQRKPQLMRSYWNTNEAMQKWVEQQRNSSYGMKQSSTGNFIIYNKNKSDVSMSEKQSSLASKFNNHSNSSSVKIITSNTRISYPVLEKRNKI